MAKDYFSAMNKTLAQLEDEAISLGANPKSLNPMNALRSISKALGELDQAQTTAKELGYKSLPIALKALRQFKHQEIDDINQLPEVFHTVSNIWLSGKADSAPNKQDGFKPLSLSQAKRRHRVITPLLIEAWQLSKGDEVIRENIEYEYRTTSVDWFEKQLYRYIYDLEPVTLEEEFNRVLPETDDALSESLRLVTDPDIIYNVVKKTPTAE
jgi:hypothetical protein